MNKQLVISSRNSGETLATFNMTEAERMVDLLTKWDCYGVGDNMIKRIGDLQGFFEDSDTDKPYSVFMSNNTAMVLFNIATELLGQFTAQSRMIHTKILHVRRNREDKKDTTIGQNMRADVIYMNMSSLARLVSALSTAIFAGDSIRFEETRP